ncbi:M1 family metallopeptidase [Alteromonas sp. KUL106]|uniref:M1 family metallopeptidase n=1 Tax=Alteromonas sp. KUL106 TaxID=2480799 RepID=UPI0012E49769|nr:ERAP1-like C-terminal domain-containing protein [Alteromonas sp. KUL106]GFD67787.1 hypothetical protein KUL106_10500 [Alteromonas sp. KUL106]
MRRITKLAMVVASACAFTSLSTTSAVAQETALSSAVAPLKKTLADVEYRLPSHVAPTFQRIHLNIDPDVPTYTGTTTIDVTVKKTTHKVGFYQQDLTVSSARLVSGETIIPLSVSISDYDINWGQAQSEIAPGKYQLEINFEGKINTSSDGMYLSRFHLAGATVENKTWAIPLKLTYQSNGKIHNDVVFIDKQTTVLPQLAEADWVFPNDDATGYFRWSVESSQLNALLDNVDALNKREKKNLLYNYQALLNADEVGIDSVMKVLNSLAKDKDPAVIRAAVSVLEEFDYLVNDQNQDAYAALLNKTYMPLLTELTLSQGEQDSADVIRLRNQLYSLLGAYANSEALVEQSVDIAKQYLDDTTSVPSGIAGTAIEIATKNSNDGDQTKWFNTIIDAFKKAQLPNVKSTLVYSMHFEDKATVFKMLDLALTDEITPANTMYMVVRVARNLDDHSLLYEWLDENKDALIKKMPDYHVNRMPEFVSTTCSADNLQMAENFYGALSNKYKGMARGVEIMRDESKQCLRLKAAFQNDFDRYLSHQ